ncbi:sugar phosphate isomerase/epimerase family protein [Pontibacter sp. BT731]|uniref:sugar phosphate isomerase/epimerase family protein n=1 Tax=Pontibacter coccineus TaxID=3063328 RepID=UPI0026E41921|nr:sugar phosphate isomerase/epimerase family protein [Pontibacter sp. BT731]MDO6390106.1 sugar phosphate isomerase/epimerase family protein [Pontibacter sp. BT731]
MKKTFNSYLLVFLLYLMTVPFAAAALPEKAPKPLKIGYALGLTKVSAEQMKYAKSVGIDYVEISFGGLIDGNRNFKVSDEEMTALMHKAKKAADDAGIQVWSIHMPFGKRIDLSMTDETERQQVVALHRKVLGYCKILQPQIILFHPSYYLGLNEREARKKQLVKSATELNKTVRSMNATMVIENMLGPELLVDAERERPLCRTVDETMEIMNRLPKSIYAAVDMNHIKNPENLIRALGKRLKSVHIADGTGEAENHYFPCSGQGNNNWTEILAALHEARYTGPFLYESAFEDARDLKACYESLYSTFVEEKQL